MTYINTQIEFKHPRGYGTIHMIAVCKECGAVLADCGWRGGECNYTAPKQIRWRDCTEGSLLAKQHTTHWGTKGGL